MEDLKGQFETSEQLWKNVASYSYNLGTISVKNFKIQ